MSWIRTVFKAVKLLRVHNCAIGGFSVVVGGIVGGGDARATVTGAIVAFLAAAGGYALNDIFDLEVDRAVKPWRPLPSGLSTRIAWVLCIALWSDGLIIAFSGGMVLAVFYCTWLGLLTGYTLVMKKMGLIGHLASSAASSSGILLGGFIVGQPIKTILPFTLAFLLHMMREIVKSMADRRGDLEFEIGTVAVRWGIRASLWLATWLAVAVLMLSIVPFIIDQFGGLYLVIVAGAIYPIVLVGVRLLWVCRDLDEIQGQAARTALLLKIAMPIGLLAFITGRVA